MAVLYAHKSSDITDLDEVHEPAPESKFWHFLDGIGTKINTKGWTKYLGDLSTWLVFCYILGFGILWFLLCLCPCFAFPSNSTSPSLSPSSTSFSSSYGEGFLWLKHVPFEVVTSTETCVKLSGDNWDYILTFGAENEEHPSVTCEALPKKNISIFSFPFN